MIECRVIETPLDHAAAVALGEDGRAGGIATFIGVVRRSSSGRVGDSVTRLEYEAYVPMAEAEMFAIAGEAVERFGAVHVAVHHRVGVLEIGEPAVVIAVSTPHRAEAFDACRYIIEELKQRVPIWKKEVFQDGSEWVNARP